jgi:uncharacterized protein (DUF608 family)
MLIFGVVLAALAPAAASGATRGDSVHWGFENRSGATLQGWKLISDPARSGPNLATREDPASDPPINPEGHSYLSTGETGTPGVESDAQTARLASPVFKLRHRFLSFLAGARTGSFSDKKEGTSVTACRFEAGQPDNCAVLITTPVDTNSRALEYHTLDLRGAVGKRIFLIAADSSQTRRLLLDNVRANAPAMPMNLRVSSAKQGLRLTWDRAADDHRITKYRVSRSGSSVGPWKMVGVRKCQAKSCRLALRDRKASNSHAYYYRVAAVSSDGTSSEPNLAYFRPSPHLMSKGKTQVYKGRRLTGIEFPVGGIGAGGIRHFGTGERNESWIFNVYGIQPPRYQSMVPNSFFAIRAARPGAKPVVRALQTRPVGTFAAMKSLSFTGEYPLATYRFTDPALPVRVTESVESPMIPGNLKDSAVPTAIYTFTLHNPTRRTVRASVLATQQNAVGFDGEGEIGGADGRQYSGYGSNQNQIRRVGGRTRLSMTGDDGSMALSMYGSAVSGTPAWGSNSELRKAFGSHGSLSGGETATSPADSVTVDGALARQVRLKPGATKKIKVVLSWNFPKAERIFGGKGMMYSTWWPDADSVDEYVATAGARLASQTRRYHDALYGSNLPRYLLDRISGNTATLHSPTMFWASNGFFGGWEGLGCCWNMPTHVWHYAQSPARLWPQIGRMFESQWFASMHSDGLIPYRYDTPEYAIDGQAGVVLSAYRDYLNSPDETWLTSNWSKIKSAMEYIVDTSDPDGDGVLQGTALTTLDQPQSVDNPWLGSLYLAALNASARMAETSHDTVAAGRFSSLYESGRNLQASRYWQGRYFTQRGVTGPEVRSTSNAVDIDMLLGQWWSSQLGLGDIFGSNRMSKAMGTLFGENFNQTFMGSNPYSNYVTENASRGFVGPTDGGMIADTWPDGGQPALVTLYNSEVWAGREYSAAATMIDLGRVRQGLRVVQAVSARYDGRIRNEPYIFKGRDKWLESCGAGDGAGNPFGDVECGKWYGRSLSSWSLLLALQGFSFDGPRGEIGFAPEFKPENHRSFFTAGEAWGSFAQKRAGGLQRETIGLAYGRLRLTSLEFRVNRKARVRGLTVRIGHRSIPARATTDHGRVTVRLRKPLQVKAGQRLVVSMRTERH